MKDPAKQAFYRALFPDLIGIMQIAGVADFSWPEVQQFMAGATADGLVPAELIGDATTDAPTITADDVLNARNGDW